jgi:hypothetical protein
MEQIASALKTNTTLRSFVFTSCEINDNGAKALAEALICNRTLTKLDLEWNRISKSGIKALEQLEQANPELKVIVSFQKPVVPWPGQGERTR